MRWSFPVGRVAGIPLRIHATFFLLLAFVAFAHLEGGVASVVQGIFFTLLLFGCVVLHELGHGLVARHYGLRVRDITLLPIGGLATIEKIPEDPRQELCIAIAGPLVNVAIAAVLLGFQRSAGALVPADGPGLAEGPLAARLLVVNVALAAFNMVPAFPMDGGRILRALLAFRMDWARATRVAARTGQAIAFLFGIVGLLWNPFLLFIAFFVYVGAEQESATATMKAVFQGRSVRDAMIVRFRTLAPEDTVAMALTALLEGAQQDFPLVDEGRPVGVLTRKDLLVAVAEGNEQRRLGDVVPTDRTALSPDDPLAEAMERLREHEVSALPVLEHGRTVGLLTLENLVELTLIDGARRQAHA